MAIRGIDHVAAPLQRVDEMAAFYAALGFEVRQSAGGLLYSVHAGATKINFHAPELWQRASFTLRGPTAVPGSGDFCFAWEGTPEALGEALSAAGAGVIEGPVAREGGAGQGTSVYVRDPDENLLEFIIYPP